MDIRKQVGLNVRRLREAKGWSQEELAFEAGMHRTYISGIERGVRNPTVIIVDRIATKLEVGPERLLQNSDHNLKVVASKLTPETKFIQ